MSTGGLGTAIVVGVGHGNGLGAALARRLAREGLRTVIAGRSEDKLKAVAEDVQSMSGELVYSVTDATSETQITELFGRAVAQDASLQLVVFNAGANAAVPFLDIGADLFESLWRQSAFGGFLVGREAVRHMLPRARGTPQGERLKARPDSWDRRCGNSYKTQSISERPRMNIFYRLLSALNKELASWIAIWQFLRGLDRLSFYQDIDGQADLSNNAEIKKGEFQTTRRRPPVMRGSLNKARSSSVEKASVGSRIAIVR